MNLALLKKHIDANIEAINKGVPELKADGSNAQDFFTADVIGGKSFVQNYGGYPRSDIEIIQAAASLELQKALLDKLTDFSDATNPNAGLTDVQLMLAHKSKYQQCPSELQAYYQSLIEQRNAIRLDAQRKAAAAAKTSPKKADVKLDDNGNT